MTLPTKEQLLVALARTENLAPAPRTLGRALHLLRDPHSGLHAIAELISRDSALAVDVLRCANSAYFSRETSVADVAEAVHVIGFHETIRLVSLVAIQHTTHRDLGSYGIAAEDYWAESLFNGLFLAAVVEHLTMIDEGEAYTTGLLRFVGRLAIDQTLRDLGAGLFWDGRFPMTEWERENVGLTQAEVGALLLRKWEFPDRIVRAVEAQDAAETADLAETEPLAAAMHFAASLLPAGQTLAAIAACTDPDRTTAAEHPFARYHGITADMIRERLRKAHAAFVTINQTLYR